MENRSLLSFFQGTSPTTTAQPAKDESSVILIDETSREESDCEVVFVKQTATSIKKPHTVGVRIAESSRSNLRSPVPLRSQSPAPSGGSKSPHPWGAQIHRGRSTLWSSWTEQKYNPSRILIDRLQHRLRSQRNLPYTLYADADKEPRLPGSGEYAFDNIRNLPPSWTTATKGQGTPRPTPNDSLGTTEATPEACAEEETGTSHPQMSSSTESTPAHHSHRRNIENLKFLVKYLNSTSESTINKLAGHRIEVINVLNQLRVLDAESVELKLIATAFYSRNWWQFAKGSVVSQASQSELCAALELCSKNELISFTTVEEDNNKRSKTPASTNSDIFTSFADAVSLLTRLNRSQVIEVLRLLYSTQQQSFRASSEPLFKRQRKTDDTCGCNDPTISAIRKGSRPSVSKSCLIASVCGICDCKASKLLRAQEMKSNLYWVPDFNSNLSSAKVDKSPVSHDLLREILCIVVTVVKCPVYRITSVLFHAIWYAHVWMFGTNGYDSGDASRFLNHGLDSTLWIGDVNRTQSECTDASLAASSHPFSDQMNTTSDSSLVTELSSSFLAYMDALIASNMLVDAVECGRRDKAFVVLHETSTQLMNVVEMWSKGSHHAVLEVNHLDWWGWKYFTLRTLACALLRGCNLLEREKRYEDALHYLSSACKLLDTDRMKRVFRWNRIGVNCNGCFHNANPLRLHYLDLFIRLTRDMEHLGRKNHSLSLIETCLKESSLLFPTLSNELCVINSSPWLSTRNCAGGVGMTVLRSCLSLSTPPRRWKQPNYSINQCAKEILKGRRVEIVSSTDTESDKKLAKKSSVNKTPRGWVDEHQNKVIQGVEDYVLSQYEAQGWIGMHSENGLCTTYLLFCNIRDQQMMDFPLSLLASVWMVESGCEQSHIRLQEIASGSAVSILERNWGLFQSKQIRGVNWVRNTFHEVVRIVECIGGKVLSTICAMYLEDNACWNGGIPDLFLWRPSPEPPKHLFVEVKGPGDSLSDRQRAWIDKLVAANANIRVCHVQEKQ